MTHTTSRPIPQGGYPPAIHNGELIYTSGFTPRREGKLIRAGKLKVDAPVKRVVACVDGSVCARVDLS